MSRAQWDCVRALITALDEAIAPEGASLPVRLQEDWTHAYVVEPGGALTVAPLNPPGN